LQLEARVREQTAEFETHLRTMISRLEVAGGIPLREALQYMHAVQTFVANCMTCGCEHDLRIAMERAGLGDLADALLAIG
jgi:hypothetical protein